MSEPYHFISIALMVVLLFIGVFIFNFQIAKTDKFNYSILLSIPGASFIKIGRNEDLKSRITAIYIS